MIEETVITLTQKRNPGFAMLYTAWAYDNDYAATNAKGHHVKFSHDHRVYLVHPMDLLQTPCRIT